MAKYSDEFKSHAVYLLFKLQKEGTVEVDLDFNVNNVRELVAFLEISSYSLYKWAENFEKNPLGENEIEVVKTEVIEDVIEDDFFDPHDYPKESYKTYDEGIFNGRFYAWLGAGLNIPYASRNAKETNMLKIGLELIKRSGLVDCDKVKRAMGGK